MSETEADAYNKEREVGHRDHEPIQVSTGSSRSTPRLLQAIIDELSDSIVKKAAAVKGLEPPQNPALQVVAADGKVEEWAAEAHGGAGKEAEVVVITGNWPTKRSLANACTLALNGVSSIATIQALQAVVEAAAPGTLIFCLNRCPVIEAGSGKFKAPSKAVFKAMEGSTATALQQLAESGVRRFVAVCPTVGTFVEESLGGVWVTCVDADMGSLKRYVVGLRCD
jgi:hypothetical protein